MGVNTGYVYPQLVGQDITMSRYPQWNSVIDNKSPSGLEVRINYQTKPLWRWDIQYNILRAEGFTQGGTTYEEFEELMGFFNFMYGGNASFAYEDQYFNTVTNQNFATIQPNDYYWVITVPTGSTAYPSGSEPIGYLNVDEPYSFYKNGVLIDPAGTDSAYTIYTDTPQFMAFSPTSSTWQNFYHPGDVLSWSGSFYYDVRFSTDTLEFEKFMSKMWDVKTVTLLSAKAFPPTNIPAIP